MYYHMIAFLAGFLLDLLIGDPHWLYHPVRLIGNRCTACDWSGERSFAVGSLCDCAGGRLYFRKYHDLSDPCDEMPES